MQILNLAYFDGIDPERALAGIVKGFYRFAGEKEYYLKRAYNPHNPAIKNYAEPRSLAALYSELAYREINTVLEVCFSKFAHALMPERTPIVELCTDQKYWYIASERIDAAIARYHFPLNCPQTINHDTPLAIQGLAQIMLVSEFLGDDDYLSLGNLGITLISNQNWEMHKIDFGKGGIFRQWDLADFLEKSTPAYFAQKQGQDYLGFSYLLSKTDFVPEKDATLKTLAEFDINRLMDIWREHRPILLAEAHKIKDPDARIRVADYISKDTPVVILRERQADIIAMVNNEPEPDKAINYVSFLNLDRVTFSDWQSQLASGTREPRAPLTFCR